VSKLDALEAIYDFYDRFTEGFSMACTRGCSTCCTTNVTLTSLETDYLLKSERLDQELLGRLEAQRQKEHFVPSTTINTTAAMCLAQKPIPEETSPITFNPCPLLDEGGLCSVYEHRPFACRAMSSETVCTDGGQADMPPFLVTVILAIYQILEHIDAEGWYGNLLDMIPIVQAEKDKTEGMVASQEGRIKTNRRLPCFIIPPDDAIRFKSFMRRLSKKEAGGISLGELLPEEYSILS
jgi:Fe-S-cluster containining protein